METSNKGYLSDYDWDKRSVSDISSIYSSNINKNHSLLSKRDNQMRMIGYYNKGGLGTSFLEGGPGFHPYDSEMATKIHYVVHEGEGLSSRPSTLDRKMMFSGGRRDSTLDKRSKSLDLRAPFYFDKDGYFSDTNVWQTNEDIYSIPMKKTKKKKDKTNVSRQHSSVSYANEPVGVTRVHSSKKNKKKESRKSDRGFVTPPADYAVPEIGVSRRGGTQTTSVSAVLNSSSDSQTPLIYVTPPDCVAETQVKQVTPIVETFVIDSGPKAREIHMPPTSSVPQTNIISQAATQLPEESSITLPTGMSKTRDGDPHDASTIPRSWNLDKTGGQQRHEERQRKGGTSTHVSRSSSRHRNTNGTGRPDDVSHVLHKAHRVEQHLKEQPQDRRDLQDQVISFRRYPSPVPKANRQLLRHSSKRSGREN